MDELFEERILVPFLQVFFLQGLAHRLCQASWRNRGEKTPKITIRIFNTTYGQLVFRNINSKSSLTVLDRTFLCSPQQPGSPLATPLYHRFPPQEVEKISPPGKTRPCSSPHDQRTPLHSQCAPKIDIFSLGAQAKNRASLSVRLHAYPTARLPVSQSALLFGCKAVQQQV